MLTIHALQPELLSAVFSHTPLSPNDNNDLCRYSLVCRDWREPAQLALFGALGLNDEERAQAWLASPGRQRFRVKHVEFSRRFKNVEIGLRALDACPDLLSLDVDEVGAYDWCSHKNAAGSSVGRSCAEMSS